MTEFTKGEWHVNTIGSKTLIDTQTGLTIAQVYDMEGHPYNANLIACAPDMYKELESAMSMLDSVWKNTGSMGARYGRDKISKLLTKVRD